MVFCRHVFCSCRICIQTWDFGRAFFTYLDFMNVHDRNLHVQVSVLEPSNAKCSHGTLQLEY